MQVLHHRVQLCSNFRPRFVVAASVGAILRIISETLTGLGLATIIARVNIMVIV